jgi:polar amino acid transport system substrate-binding protein
MRRLSRAALAAVSSAAVLAAVAACGPSGTSSPSASSTSTNACDSITTVQDGKLTVGTSNPAYPPYVLKNDPSSGKGFESAVAYAVADKMGFTTDQVAWTFAPFNKLFAPGTKDYDFALNQITILPGRERAVTFSDPYYSAANGIIVLKDSKYANATSLADLKDAKFGVQINTTGQIDVEQQIGPTQQVAVYPDSTAATQALKNGQIDAFVTDLPTTIYLRDFVVNNSLVVGQFPPAESGTEWGLVLQKDNPLVGCVNQALSELKSDGTLDQITQKWMGPYTEAPVLS